MNQNLEKILGTYKEQKKTLGSHLVAFAASTAVASLASKLAADATGDSTTASSLVATVSAMGVYWPTFICGLIVRDRKEFVNQRRINWSAVGDKAAEYASWIGIGEAVYGAVRMGLHAYLQHNGHDAAQSSMIADTVTGSTYTVGLPFIQVGIDYVKSKAQSFMNRHTDHYTN